MQSIFKNKVRYLLAILIVIIFLSSLIIEGFAKVIIQNISILLLIIIMVFTLNHDKKHFWTIIVLGSLMVISRWIGFFYIHTLPYYSLFLAAFCFYSATVILRHIIQAKTISHDEIYAGVSSYLLIGLGFAGLYTAIQQFTPGSYSGGELFTDFIYFSFVTLTTVGYGDVTPLTRFAQNVAIIESIIGVFFLAVLIGRIVSSYSLKKE